jgi:hypothetical protein
MQYFAKKFIYLILFISIVQLVSAQQKSKVEILGADLFEGQTTALGSIKKLIGNVVLKDLLPKRLGSQKRIEDAKKICPCFWHKDEIKKDGHCFCNLYVKS